MQRAKESAFKFTETTQADINAVRKGGLPVLPNLPFMSLEFSDEA